MGGRGPRPSLTHPSFPRALAASLALVLLAAPCAGAATKRVIAGPPSSKPPAGVPRDFDIDQFFPATVTIHAGDSVRWRINGTHTVTFPRKGSSAPPYLAFDPFASIAGVNDPTGAPFWFNDQPRLVYDRAATSRQGGFAEDGSALTGSGIVSARPGAFELAFPQAGTFSYVCALHPGMRGIVRVLAPGRPIPSPKADKAVVRRQLRRDATLLRSRARQRGEPGPFIQAGNERDGVILNRFVPARKTVRVGEAVTFRASRGGSRAHTVTFGPPAYLFAQSQVLSTQVPALDGTPIDVLNPIVWLPSDFPQPTYDGARHGNGFFNLGLIDDDVRTSSALAPRTRSMRFSRTGVYRFSDLLHPGMQGVVRVRP